MKAIVAQFIFESNTFNPDEAELALFTQGGVWCVGEFAVRRWASHTPSQLSGSLDVLEAAGWTTAPVLAIMCGSPAGRLSRTCFSQIRSEFAAALRASMPADVMLLHLHGSACAAGEDDVEGNLLELVRRELSFQGAIVVSLDLHANITRRMLQNATSVTAYRTMPHTDFVATGHRAAHLAMHDTQTWTFTLAKIAALIPPTDTSDKEGRFASILSHCRRLETSAGIKDISVFPVQPWLDIPELGSSVIITGGDLSTARKVALELAGIWYAQRNEWATGIQPWDKIKKCLYQKHAIPWILVDSADATTGGSPGHSAELLRQLLPINRDLPGTVLLWVVDPASVQAAERNSTHFTIGEQLIEFTADVQWTGEGRFTVRGRSYTDQVFSMGAAAVLKAGQLCVVVSTAPSIGADPAFYECLGLDPDKALAVHTKSLAGWKAGYSAYQSRGLVFDGAGCTTLNFERLPYNNRHRDIFPLTKDPSLPITVWQST